MNGMCAPLMIVPSASKNIAQNKNLICFSLLDISYNPN
jgi:hypothetical protein